MSPTTSALKPSEIKIYPNMGVSAIQSHHTGGWRLWVLCKKLDQAGSGWIGVNEFREAINDLKISRQLHKIWLDDALETGLFEFRMKDGLLDCSRYWIANPAIAARELGTVKLGAPVIIKNYRRLFRKGWKPLLWGAYLLQGKQAPRGQRNKYKETRIAPRTQRRYERHIKIKRIFNEAPITNDRTCFDGYAEFDNRIIFKREGELIQRLPTTLLVQKYNYSNAQRGRHDKILKVFSSLSEYPAGAKDKNFRLFYEVDETAEAQAKRYRKLDDVDIPIEVFGHKKYMPIGGRYARNTWTTMKV